MAIDKFEKAIDTLLSMTPAGLAATGPKKLKNLMDKVKKEKAKGKPKGKSPSMILGSASKAGMQGKQGKRPKRGLTPRTGPKFGPRAKTNGREGSLAENFRKINIPGKRK